MSFTGIPSTTYNGSESPTVPIPRILTEIDPPGDPELAVTFTPGTNP